MTDANSEAFETVLTKLVGLNSTKEGPDASRLRALITEHLTRAGFEVTQVTSLRRGAPLLVAERTARAGGGGRCLIYNHYDVEPPQAGWTEDPFRLRGAFDRWLGLGVGDNKGALAARLLAVEDEGPAPAITWLIQGEEESGSAVLREWLGSVRLGDIDLCLDENGWDDIDGTQRVLCGRVGKDGLVEPAFASGLQVALEVPGARWRLLPRMLNKRLVPGGCAFQSHLPERAIYLAIGTNDASTRIHQPDESIPQGLALRHIAQTRRLLAAVAKGALS